MLLVVQEAVFHFCVLSLYYVYIAICFLGTTSTVARAFL